jgi:EpsI family protein
MFYDVTGTDPNVAIALYSIWIVFGKNRKICCDVSRPSSHQSEPMKINHFQVLLASAAILGAGVLAEALKPRQLLASTQAAPNLETSIPRDFGEWHLVPNIGLVTPSDPGAYVRNELEQRIYSQELARGYADAAGNVVMFLVAYGPVQNYRLKSHLPEVCYGAAGFRVSAKNVIEVSYLKDAPPSSVSRVVAEREGRFEPITYWMKVGGDVVTGVFDRQIARMKYGLEGVIPDGALIRVSTVGLSETASYQLQDKFVHDLLSALSAKDRKFFTG